MPVTNLLRAGSLSVLMILQANSACAEKVFPSLGALLQIATDPNANLDEINVKFAEAFGEFSPLDKGYVIRLVPIMDGASWTEDTWIASNFDTMGEGPLIECSRSAADSLSEALKFYEFDAPRPGATDLIPADRMTWNQLMELRVRSFSTGGIELPANLDGLLVCTVKLASKTGVDFDAARFLADMVDVFDRVDVPGLENVRKYAPQVSLVAIGRDASLGPNTKVPNLFINLNSLVGADMQPQSVELMFFALSTNDG